MSSGPGSLGMWALSWGGLALLESSAATFPAVAFKFFCLLINIWNLPRVAHTRSRDIAIGADPWGVQALVVFFFFSPKHFHVRYLLSHALEKVGTNMVASTNPSSERCPFYG